MSIPFRPIALFFGAFALCLGPLPVRAATSTGTSPSFVLNLQQSLVLTVLDGRTDTPISGANVSAGGTPYVTDANGRATIDPATASASLIISKTGYSTVNTACQVPGLGTSYQTERMASALGTTLRPIINSAEVRPFVFTVQATGVDVPLFVVPDVTWNQVSGGQVHWSTAVDAGSVGRGSPNTIIELDPTRDLPTSGLTVPKAYTITLEAENAAGRSPPLTREVIAVAMPAWLYNMSAYYTGSDSSARRGLSVMPFAISRDLIPPGMGELDLGIVTIESSLAFFASGELGGSGGSVSGFRGTYGFEGGVEAGIRVEANQSGPGGIRPYGGIEGTGKVKINGEWYPAITCNGYLELKIRGSIGVVVPVRAILLLDPSGAGAAFNQWINTWPKSARDKLDDFAYVDASVGASLATELPIGISSGRLYLDTQNGLYGLGTDIKIKGHVGVSVLYTEAKLGGGGMAWFRSSSQGDLFDHAEYTIEGEVIYGFMQWEKSFGVTYTKTVPDAPPGVKSRIKPSGGDGSMSLIPRDYVARPDYGTFRLQAQDVKEQRLATSGRISPKGLIHSSAFVEDVFPNTTAALAGTATNDVTVLFSYDNTNLIQVQAMDIYWTRWNGSAWSVPAPVVTNTQTELHPAVAYDVTNRPVGVWMRMRDPNYTDSTNVMNYLSQFDIVGSLLNATTGVWAAPQVLSINPCLNADPRMSRSPNGSLAAWWYSNPSNQFEGGVSSNNAPSQWWWARWNAGSGTFGAAEAIDTNVVGALSPTLAYGGTNAWLLWAQDLDRDYSTSNDTALVMRYWNGAAWSTNTTLSATGEVVRGVETVMLSDGKPLAVWWRNGDLVSAMGPAFGGAQIVRTNSADLVSQRFHLVASPDDRYVLLVFPLTTSNGLNLAYRAYDAEVGVWGGDFAFESTNSLDFGIAPSFIGDEMWAAYTRGVLAYSTTVATVGSTNIVISNIPYRVRTDLMLAQFELDADVSVVSVDVPPTYPPVIEVTVANEGDVVLTNLTIEVREDSTSGNLLASYAPSEAIPPHTTANYLLPFSPSENSATKVLVAMADPADVIDEFREFNNVISNRVLWTDFALAGLAQERGVGATNLWLVQVSNRIARTISNATVNLRRDATNGTVLSTAAINLPAYQMAEVILPLNTSGLAEGTVLVTEVVAGPAAGETNSTRALVTTAWSPDALQMPAMVENLRFLRPGISNALPMSWTPPEMRHDGVRVVRIAGTNEPEEIGFSEVPAAMYQDMEAGLLTQVTYRVAAYNGLTVGPLSDPISTNFVPTDANGDGLPDAWQIEHFGSVTNARAHWSADDDRDGYENWREYLFGSNPTNDLNFPKVEIERGAAGETKIIWRGAKDQPYTVEMVGNLDGWAGAERTSVISTGEMNLVIEPSPTNRGFYRVGAP